MSQNICQNTTFTLQGRKGLRTPENLSRVGYLLYFDVISKLEQYPTGIMKYYLKR
jgi:hypothetical protein